MKLSIKKANWIIKIFEGATVLVKEGDEVQEGDVILTSEKRTIRSFDASIVLSKISKNKLYEFIENWNKKEVKEGELLFEEKGLFSRKFFSFYSGTFIGVDEFYNVCIEESSNGEKKEIYSPVKAKVSKIDEEGVSLEFRAIEFNGEGVVEGKAWGDSYFKEINKISDLNFSLEGKIILTSNSDLSFVTKADVVGVRALVIDKKDKEKFDKIEEYLPILALDTEYMDRLKSEFGNENRRVLLNSKNGRLLFTLE